MTELGGSLEQMGFVQLALLFGFVAAYVLALGAMLGRRWRTRAALAAALLATGFVVETAPWVHGALLVVFTVAGIGLFVVMSWLLAHLVAPAPARVAEPALAPPSRPPAADSVLPGAGVRPSRLA